MQRYSISQLPVVRDGELGSLADVIGSLQDRDLLDRVFKDADALHEDVAAAMQPPLATVDAAASVDEIVNALTGRHERGAGRARGRPVGVVTRSDLLEYLARRRQLKTADGGRARAAAREHRLVGELDRLVDHVLRGQPPRLPRADHAQLAVVAALEYPARAEDVELRGDDVEAAEVPLARDARDDARLAAGRDVAEKQTTSKRVSPSQRLCSRASFEPRETSSSGA